MAPGPYSNLGNEIQCGKCACKKVVGSHCAPPRGPPQGLFLVLVVLDSAPPQKSAVASFRYSKSPPLALLRALRAGVALLQVLAGNMGPRLNHKENPGASLFKINQHLKLLNVKTNIWYHFCEF